jgi:hypothetical protein
VAGFLGLVEVVVSPNETLLVLPYLADAALVVLAGACLDGAVLAGATFGLAAVGLAGAVFAGADSKGSNG